MKWIKYSQLNKLINGFIRLVLWDEPGQAKVLSYKRCFGMLPYVQPHFRLYSYFPFFLFSVVEPENGKIEIDDYNLRLVGLDVLRRGLALVPQDSTLCLGTLRDNL